MVSVLHANLFGCQVGFAVRFRYPSPPQTTSRLASLADYFFPFLPQCKAWSQDSLYQQNYPVFEDRGVIACVCVC